MRIGDWGIEIDIAIDIAIEIDIEIDIEIALEIDIEIEIEINSFFNHIDLSADRQEHRCIACKKDASLSFRTHRGLWIELLTYNP